MTAAAVLFTAHSLPIRTVETDLSFRCKYCDCDESCRYRDGLQETADEVARRLGLDRSAIAWQSAGRTDDPWWGPPVEDVIEDLGAADVPGVVVCSAGFVADHLEILYDLDIEAKEIAERVDVAFARTRMPNADPEFLDVLAQVVREHMAEVHVLRIAVVGGGVAGLTTAYRLARATADVVVIETLIPGGALRTVDVGGFPLPAGADAFWGRKPWAVDLCRALGLEVVAPASSGTYLWTDAGLVAYPSDTAFGIPGDPGDVLRWPGLSRAGRRRALADLLKTKRKDEGDQTLGALLRRRLGDEATDLAIAPLLTAPSLGDVDAMSLRATFPDLERWEDWQGSLIRGSQAARRSLRKGPEVRPMLVRPRGGVEALAQRLSVELGERVRSGCGAVRLERGAGWRLVLDGGEPVDADAVVLATPASVARRLLGAIAPQASEALEDLGTASAVTAVLVYPEDTQTALPDGTGFVVPRGKAPMRSCAWLSSRWPDPSYGSRAIVSCALGGAGDDDVVRAPDADVVQACARHLAAVLPLPEAPEHAAVVRWPDVLPRYELGHVERVARIRERLPPGIFVVGQAYDGADVADVVRAAGEVADAVIQELEP